MEFTAFSVSLTVHRHGSFAWIEERKDEWSVTLLCSVLEVSRSGFYAWRSRDVSVAEERREEMTEEVKEIHAEVKGR